MMELLSFGSSMNNIRSISFFFIILVFNSCEKENCYRIVGKEIINNEYYFLLDNNNVLEYNRNTNESSGIPDPYGTGKVDRETYDSVQIGENYCK